MKTMSKESNEPDVVATESSSQSLSMDEINQLKEKVRQEERAKLQSRLSKSDRMAEQVQSLEADKIAIEKERDTITASLDSLRKSIKSESGTVDIPHLIKEVTDNARMKAEKDIQERVVALDNRLKQIEAENSTLKVDNCRSKLLARAKDSGEQFIAELVTGNSSEELEASLLKAKETYVQYFGAAKKAQAPTPASAATNGPTPVSEPAAQTQAHASPVEPQVPGKEGVLGLANSLRGVKSDKAKKTFAENRQELLDLAEAEAAQQNALVQ